MAKILAALAALSLLGAAQPVATGPGTPYYDGIPPVKYQRTGFAIVLFVPPALINQACGATDMPPGLTLLACTRRLKAGPKVTIMPDPCAFATTSEYARILCHENAHALGGWSGTHPL